MPDGSRIIGVARSQLSPADYVAQVEAGLPPPSPQGRASTRSLGALRRAASPTSPPTPRSTNGWDQLAARLGGRDEVVRVFYLATSPELFGPICERLRASAW